METRKKIELNRINIVSIIISLIDIIYIIFYILSILTVKEIESLPVGGYISKPSYILSGDIAYLLTDTKLIAGFLIINILIVIANIIYKRRKRENYY